MIDFHTHTTASDGALSPSVLLNRAREAGIGALAITDHDTIAGYQQLAGCKHDGVELVPGVEFSCVWGGVTIHVVGLGFDARASSMTAMLAQLDSARAQRAARIAEKLAKKNMPGALEGARAKSAGAQVGRPHFAAWMVDAGHVSDIGAAFDRYLGQGKIGDVKAYWPALKDAVAAIVDGGGVAVLAHPLKYRQTRTKLHALCRDFVAAGGQAIEILNGRQTDDEIQRLRRLAQNYRLMVSAGSDFHRDWQHGAGLGVDTRVAAGLNPVWDYLFTQ